MKYEAEFRKQLMDNATQLVAKGGFEAATTRALTTSSEQKINDVYIYRLYGSKDGLFEAVFAALDDELFTAFWKRCQQVHDIRTNTREKLYEIFVHAWKFLLQNEAKCRYYVRFYYSVYFQGDILTRHRKTFSKLISHFDSLFKEEADTFSIMHSVFSSLLDFAIRVYNGDLEDNEANREHIFNVAYCIMQSYLQT